jgi:hypothetical protein
MTEIPNCVKEERLCGSRPNREFGGLPEGGSSRTGTSGGGAKAGSRGNETLRMRIKPGNQHQKTA